MADTWGAGRQYGHIRIGWSKDPDVADSYVIRTGLYTFTVEHDYRERWTFTTTEHQGGAGLIDHHQTTVLGAKTKTKAQALAAGSRMMLSELADAADAGMAAWLRR